MRFKVLVTRAVTETAEVQIEAESEEVAAEQAVEVIRSLPGIRWRRDPLSDRWMRELDVTGIEEVEAYPVPGKVVTGGPLDGMPFGLLTADGTVCRCGDCTLGMNRGTVVVITPNGPIFWGHAGEQAEVSLARYQNTGGAF